MEINWLDKYHKEETHCGKPLQAAFVVAEEGNEAVNGQLMWVCGECAPAYQLLDELQR